MKFFFFKFHLTSDIMAKMKNKKTANKFWEEGEVKNLINGENANRCSQYSNHFGRILKILRINLSYDPALPHLVICPKASISH